ncbi:MAG: hypothetical protein AAF927_32420 [Bacteroidota bacterium]
MNIKVSPFEYENLVRELYYRDLRQLEGLDREQAAIQTLLTYRYRTHKLKTLFNQGKALWRLLFL